MVDILRTGLSGLIAFQRALATTSHNIANANTPGYTRQRTELTNSLPTFVGGTENPQYIGTGVSVQSITRVYDDFLTQQTRSYSSNVGQLDTMDQWISQLDGTLGDTDTGLSPALKQFFSSLQDVADTPASAATRQTFLDQANTLTTRFQELDSQMDALRQGVNQGLSNTVNTINTLAENIAKANQAIALSQGGNGVAAPDLLDQRDQLVAELAQRVSVSTVTQDDGTLSVFIGNGQTLVLGNKANTLETTTSTSDPRKLDVRFKNTNASINNLLNGGEIGGLLAFQTQVLDPAQNKLGLMAVGLANTFNAQHKLGMDLDGDLGSDFFKMSGPQTIANAKNTGSGALTVTISDIGKVQPSDYELSYNGSNYSLRRLSDDSLVYNNTAWPPSSAVDGLTISSSGAMNAGDRFLIQPTAQAAGNLQVAIQNPKDIAAAAPIKTSAAQSNTGTAKISAGTVLDTTNANLLNTVDIAFTDATHYTINGSGSYTYTSGANIDYNGWRIQLGGTPATGDQFQISSNSGGVGDNRNALALAGLQTRQTLLNSASSYQDIFSQMTAEVGAQGSGTKNTLQAQQALLDQSTQARDSVSGVNLDEEAANLMRYQQAYEAAAKVIQIGDAIIQTLLDAVRR